MILATGGAGYIGSHTTLQLLEAGHDVVVIDNLSNSSFSTIDAIQHISGRKVHFIHGDIRDFNLLRRTFKQFPIQRVLHFAGVKAVSESVSDPLKYYDNNLSATITLCTVMSEFQVFDIIFSSSATVYAPQETPLREDDELAPCNPYGHSKLMVENVLRSLVHSNDRWKVGVLRYFNPIGAHESGLLGEDPKGEPNNLLPIALQAVSQIRPVVSVFGNDYQTQDGTAERDYIHVVDLATAHVKVVNHLKRGFDVWNIGTGRATSVLQILSSLERACGESIPIQICPRRAGDLPRMVANPSKAIRELDWCHLYDVDAAVADSWRWYSTNASC